MVLKEEIKGGRDFSSAVIQRLPYMSSHFFAGWSLNQEWLKVVENQNLDHCAFSNIKPDLWRFHWISLMRSLMSAFPTPVSPETIEPIGYWSQSATKRDSAGSRRINVWE
jgi:hypothetical protein